MRILITGGAGFIGSHLSERLLLARETLCIVDNLNNFYDPSLKRANLASVACAGQVRVAEVDICDAPALTVLFDEFRPEVVIHLAACAGVRASIDEPLFFEHVNVRGTIILLEECRKWKVQKLLFASSSSVYGIGATTPFAVDEPLNLPVSPYAATKIAGEKLCFTYSHLYDIQVTCLRFFSVYGPRQRPDLAVRKFGRMILRGEPIPVFGDGTSARDYTYVDDIIDGILSALHASHSYEIFNLGNSNPIRLVEMIHALENSLGVRATVLHLPDQPGDVPITCADISKSERLLGYHPRISFATGIQRFSSWLKTQEIATALSASVGA